MLLFSATDVSVDAPFRYLVHSLPISPPCGDRSLLLTAQRVVCIGFVAPKTGTKKAPALIHPSGWPLMALQSAGPWSCPISKSPRLETDIILISSISTGNATEVLLRRSAFPSNISISHQSCTNNTACTVFVHKNVTPHAQPFCRSPVLAVGRNACPDRHGRSAGCYQRGRLLDSSSAQTHKGCRESENNQKGVHP